MLYASGALLLVEFLADKVPWVDSLWDSVHTFIRIPAGAALAYGVFGGDQATWATVAALLGGTLAATAHTAKATTRAAANSSPEPFSNIGLSLAGDALVPGMLWLSWQHPELFFVALALAAGADGDRDGIAVQVPARSGAQAARALHAHAGETRRRLSVREEPDCVRAAGA